MNLAAVSADTDTAASVDPAVASYASEYSVTAQEAQRRLDRIEPLQEILESIRDLEGDRLAGWGIDHSGAFRGWVFLDGPFTTGAEVISRGAFGGADSELLATCPARGQFTVTDMHLCGWTPDRC